MIINRRIFIALVSAVFLFGGAAASHAEDFGTADQAKAMAERAAASFKANGKGKLLADLNNPKGPFIDRDLYVVAYGLDGTRLAHPYNSKFIGTSVLDAVDFDGKPYGKELMDLANGAGQGWVDYKFTDPTTKKLAAKSLYVLKVGDLVLGCGIYKR